jgi:2-polyprenyl-3-methyl-5-hydroxy-6-metoxy-1,4-benzoquinol methylase
MAQSSEHVYMGGRLSGFLETRRLRQAAGYIQRGSRVLDIACNEGRLLEFLPEDIVYLGIDISKTAIETARLRYPDQRFMTADLSDGFPAGFDEQFDAIVMLAFLEHIPQPGEFLGNAARFLRPDGKIIITTPAPWGRTIHDVGARLGLFSREAAEEHQSFLGKTELRQLAQAAGLRLVHYQRFLYGFNQIALLANDRTEGISLSC